MRPTLIPIILVLTAGALFALYTDPVYQGSKALKAEVAAYDDALTKTQELRRLREELQTKRNAFGEEDLTKLRRMLPDNVDNIRLIIDINEIAARRGLSLTNVELGDISGSATPRDDLAVGDSGDPVGSITLGFSLAASYDDLMLFLQDLEHSLRVINIEEIGFSVTEDSSRYATEFKVRTYWLR